MKKGIFYILCFLTLFLFINSIFHIRNYKSYILPPYNTMNVIVDVQGNNNDDVILKADNSYTEVPKSGNILNKTLKGKITSLDIFIKNDIKDKVKNIIIFNDLKIHYFKNLSDLKNEQTELCPNGNCSKYTKYEIPNTIKYNKKSDSMNFRSASNALSSSILSLASGGVEFLIPYILLFITIFYYRKNNLNIKLKGEIITCFIFLSGILIYSNCIFDYLPWTDEYATIEYSNPEKPFSSLFQDPGNPPLFYMIFRIFISIFGITTFSLKALPFLISILFLIIFFIFLKKHFGPGAANIGLFLSVINPPLIYFAQEARSYLFQSLLTVIITYVLFNILYKNRKKDYIAYGILAAVAANTHYYEIIYLIGNFIFVLVYFLFEKRYKDILNFFLSNLIGAVSFLPFFIYTSLNQALIDNNFNNWIPKTDFEQIKRCTYYVTGGLIPLILSLIFFIKNLFNKENLLKRNMIIYSYFIIFFTIISGILLSYLIRPMLVERYLLLICPLYIIFLSLIFTSSKNKYAAIFFIIWALIMQSGFFEKNNRRKGILESPMAFSKLYYQNEHPDENIYTILNFSYPQYLENREEYMIKEVTYFGSSKLNVKETIKNILKYDKNAVIFTSLLDANEENSKLQDLYTCYFNSSVDMCLWKIKGKKND